MLFFYFKDYHCHYSYYVIAIQSTIFTTVSFKCTTVDIDPQQFCHCNLFSKLFFSSFQSHFRQTFPVITSMYLPKKGICLLISEISSNETHFTIRHFLVFLPIVNNKHRLSNIPIQILVYVVGYYYWLIFSILFHVPLFFKCICIRGINWPFILLHFLCLQSLVSFLSISGSLSNIC